MQCQSLISEKIKLFYKQGNDETLENVEKFFKPAHCFDFVEIAKYLRSATGKEKDEPQSYNDYLHYYQKLLPIYKYSNVVVKAANIDELALAWLGDDADALKEYLSTASNSEIITVKTILILTSYLENALGNVYYISSGQRKPPHLLKDLLCTTEITELLGADLLLFMKILVGTPNAVNLRNIVWHGFPQPSDIPYYYRSVLLLSIHSIGCSLLEKQFSLVQRPRIKDFQHITMQIACALPIQEAMLCATLAELPQHLNCLNAGYKQYWQHLPYCYVHEQYWQFVIMMLPQIELLLRLHYGNANDFDVSAKLDEYYITMDTLFEKQVPSMPNKLNKLLTFEVGITAATFKCMYDLFVAPNGPRLRDKVSHGEVTLQAINNKVLCDVLISIALQLMAAQSSYAYIPNTYESKFHLNALTKASLNSAQQRLVKFAYEHEMAHAIQPELQLSVCIFDRPKKEAELNLLICRIAQFMETICRNFAESVATRKELLEQRSLHSKRRATLANLLAALPTIFETFVNLQNACMSMFVSMQRDVNVLNDVQATDRKLRFLKHSLKLTENCCKYAHKDRNEWVRALELCNVYNCQYKALYEFEKKEEHYLCSVLSN